MNRHSAASLEASFEAMLDAARMFQVLDSATILTGQENGAISAWLSLSQTTQHTTTTTRTCIAL